MALPTDSSHQPTLFQVIRAWNFGKRKNRVSPMNGFSKATADAETTDFMTKQGIGSRHAAVTQLGLVEIWSKVKQIFTRSYWQTWVIDPSSNFYYRWLAVVSVAVLYNLVIIIARSVFWQLQQDYVVLWVVLDYICDSLYIVDMFVQLRTAHLDQGVVVTDVNQLWRSYVKSTQFRLAALSLLPTDLVYIGVGFRYTILRINRLLRFGRMSEALSRFESVTAYPNLFRIGVLACTIVLAIHWNACLFFQFSVWVGIGSDWFVYQGPVAVNGMLFDYMGCLYWSTMMLLTLAEMPKPQTDLEFIYVITLLMVGVMFVAYIVGNIGNAVSKVSADRSEFQGRLDGIKRYMAFRKVDSDLQGEVGHWFDYIWNNRQSSGDDESVLEVLPRSFQVEISTNVHMETLKRVALFRDCERGLIAQLVLRLRPVVYGPGDYVCRKGDIGKEMYIMKKGKLAVVADDGMKVFAHLLEGTVFGEISLLNIAGNKNGNRRTANIRSVGYSDLFVLSKEDLWEALKEYPDAAKSLLETGRQMLRKDNLLDETVSREHDELASKSVHDQLDSVEDKMSKAMTKIGRLMAESESLKRKLTHRIVLLEQQTGGF